MLTLCSPGPDTSCFGCCPPIRPAHYDPLAFASSLKREFVEHRHRFLADGPRSRPIVGFSCWALGYLDEKGRRIGCLLHPSRHGGRDLRFLTGYGDKCRREMCLAAQSFARLAPAGQTFWLTLARGLNSFYFSSPRSNSLFHVLLWGPALLETLRIKAEQDGFTATELIWQQPFLVNPGWSPRGHRFLFRLVVEVQASSPDAPVKPLDRLGRGLWEKIRSLPEAVASGNRSPQAHYLHQLPLEEDFVDFLRVGLGWLHSTYHQACALQERIEELMPDFCGIARIDHEDHEGHEEL